jgi:hypothetical protein
MRTLDRNCGVLKHRGYPVRRLCFLPHHDHPFSECTTLKRLASRFGTVKFCIRDQINVSLLTKQRKIPDPRSRLFPAAEGGDPRHCADGSASAEFARPHDFGVEPPDCGATVVGIGCRPSGLQMELWYAQGRADQHADAVNLDRERKFVKRATAADPGIHVARAPVVSGDGVRPAAVSAVHLRQIGAPERPVLSLLKAIATAGI